MNQIKMLSGLFLAQFCFANTIEVDNTTSLINELAKAVAGDTILIEPGTYEAQLSESKDPGNLPNGTGYFWVGNNGTQENPIVITAKDPSQKPVLKGETIDQGYVFHITGDYVYLKDLILKNGDKGVVFDNASFGILEDSEVSFSGAELVHVRDSSNHVKINRNHIHTAGLGGKGAIGEGIYIGTDQARWGADDVAKSDWGSLADGEGYGGYDWRIDSTWVSCNTIGGGVSAELLDIKEGSRFTQVNNNVLIADSIGLRPGGQSYDDSYIDVKGGGVNIYDNYFVTSNQSVQKYIAEVQRNYSHVPASLTTDGHASIWCDSSETDGNNCSSDMNSLVEQSFDPKEECEELVKAGSEITAVKASNSNAMGERVRSIYINHKEGKPIFKGSMKIDGTKINSKLFGSGFIITPK